MLVIHDAIFLAIFLATLENELLQAAGNMIHVAISSSNLPWFQKISAIVVKSRTELYFCNRFKPSCQKSCETSCQTSCQTSCETSCKEGVLHAEIYLGFVFQGHLTDLAIQLSRGTTALFLTRHQSTGDDFRYRNNSIKPPLEGEFFYKPLSNKPPSNILPDSVKKESH